MKKGGGMEFELTKEYIEELKHFIAEEDANSARSKIENLHPADIAEIYDEISIDEARFLYLLLDDEKAADVLVELEEDDRERFLKVLPSEVIARKFIDNMDSDDAADVIGDLPEEKQEEVLQHIDDVEQAGDIVDLLNYDEDTAGGLMAKELIQVNEEWTILTCLREMRKQAEDIDEVYYVYVVDDDDILRGTLPLKKLLTNDPRARIKELCKRDIISVKVDTEREDVAAVMEKYDLVALPVVDAIGRLVGRITIDDVVDVIREEAEKDYQMISGISEDVESSDSVWLLTRARIPWLAIGLGGGIAASVIIGFFEEEVHKYVGLASFMPLIAAMGGNVGVQSSSIVVQSIAGGHKQQSTVNKLLKEFMVAMLNALILGGIIFGYSFLTGNSWPLTLSIAIAMVAVIIFASLFGTIVPILLDKFKIDPALATGPFITTSNDIVGMAIYLLIARYLFIILG
ncbi:MAG: magnesium transporter [Bacteroidales bacterium]|jgi:magnesium transporter|nr:magnesium transporter [Bacteroidales bacterium]